MRLFIRAVRFFKPIQFREGTAALMMRIRMISLPGDDTVKGNNGIRVATDFQKKRSIIMSGIDCVRT